MARVSSRSFQCLLVLMVTTSHTGFVHGATYYVDPANGNDGADGLSPTSAWATLAKLTATVFLPGDRILLRRGAAWRERLHLTASGTASQPIVVDAYGQGPAPVILGSEIVSAWDPSSAPVYTANLDAPAELVVLNGLVGSRQANPEALSAPGDWYAGGNTLYLHADAPPQGVEVATRRFTVLVDQLDHVTYRNLAVRHGFDPVWLDDSSHIRMEHLNIRDSAGYAGVFITADLADRGQANIVQHCRVGNMLGSAESLAFGNNGVGIYVFGKDIATETLIANNIVENVGHEGIALALTTDAIVRSNIVRGSAQSGIRVALETSARNIIERNEVYGNCRVVDDRFGIDLIRVGNDNVVRYNYVHGQEEVPDGPYKSGGIRFDGGDWEGFDHIDSTGNVAYYNVVYDEYVGINVFNASNVEVYNNTVVGPTGFGLALHSVSTTIPTGIVARNNLVYAETEVPIFVNAVDTITLSNNAYLNSDSVYFVWEGAPYDFSGWLSASSQDIGALFADPVLLDVPQGDYRLDALSPCIDAALPLPGLTEDFLGNVLPQQSAPDIGAHEFVDADASGSTHHSADVDRNFSISLGELLRVVQLFRFPLLHCDPAGEDGFGPGAGIQLCPNHSADYAPQDWQIGFSEVLRVVQFFNAGGYTVDEEGEDGFRPAPL